jgi:hypothetical protein
MLSLLFGRAVVSSAGRSLGDVTVLLAPGLPQQRPQQRVQVVCPLEASVAELKKRIAGKIALPVENIRLTFGGEVLRKCLCERGCLRYGLPI